jgi:nitrogen fixation NifU-like protein
MQVESMYQEIILDHYRNPHHKGLREPYEAEVHHVNPTCGDEVTLRVHLTGTGDEARVEDVSYDSMGCSISQASASVMTDLIIGKTVKEAMVVGDEFLSLMQSRGAAEPDEDVMEALKDVVDPELGINVVDLGLVYGVDISDGVATLDMTLTSAACPLTDVIEDQAHSALEGMVDDVKINWVWLPPWGPDKISEEGREQLRALGFNV